MGDTTLETIDGRPVLRFTRIVAAPLADVWRAVSEPGVVGEWFMPGRPWSKRTALDHLLGLTQERPVSSNPRSRVVWQHDDSLFTFGLSEHEDGIHLELLVTLEERDEAAIAALEVDAFLDRLAPYLAGDELTHAAFADLDVQEHRLEAYAERFGVHPTRGRDFVASMRQVLAATDGTTRR